jgi:hypothetical protein
VHRQLTKVWVIGLSAEVVVAVTVILVTLDGVACDRRDVEEPRSARDTGGQHAGVQVIRPAFRSSGLRVVAFRVLPDPRGLRVVLLELGVLLRAGPGVAGR